MSEKVVKNDADNAESKVDLTWANANTGNALILNGSTEEGTKYLEDSAAAFTILANADPDNLQVQSNYIKTLDWLREVSETKKVPKK